MKNSKKLFRYVGLPLSYIFLVLLAILFLLPNIFMLMQSFLPNEELFQLPVKFFPERFSLDGYRQLFEMDVLKYLGNTLVIVAFSITVGPLSSSIVAYGFAKMEFPGRDKLFAIMMGTIMLPGIVLQIPQYVMFVSYGWKGTLYTFIIPGIFGGGAMNIFLVRQFMRGIPNELLNAAKIDGANSFIIYLKIVMPLSIPVITLLMINAFLGSWNDFMGPLIYLKKSEMYTLSLGLYREFTSGNLTKGSFPNVRMAAGVLMSIPPAILFLIFQKQMIEGVSITGLKG